MQRSVENFTGLSDFVPIVSNNDLSYGPLSLQQIDVCTTLAAFHIYKARCFEFAGLPSGVGSSGTVVGNASADPETGLRTAEELLKGAETILSSSITNDAQAVTSSRGAQLAAAARLMLSTSSSAPLIRGAGRTVGGIPPPSPQQLSHSETQKRFLDSLSPEHRQMLSPLLCYGYLYLAQYSSERVSHISCCCEQRGFLFVQSVIKSLRRAKR